MHMIPLLGLLMKCVTHIPLHLGCNFELDVFTYWCVLGLDTAVIQ